MSDSDNYQRFPEFSYVKHISYDKHIFGVMLTFQFLVPRIDSNEKG